MKKLMRIIIAVVAMVLFGMGTALASMAVPVHHDSLMDGKKEVAMFSLAAVRMDKFVDPVQEDGVTVFRNSGRNDHSVDIITFGVVGWEKRAAAGSIVIKCYEQQDCEGEAYETIQQEFRCPDGEKLNLQYRYSYINSRARSLLAELTYRDVSPAGAPREYKGTYKIRIR